MFNITFSEKKQTKQAAKIFRKKNNTLQKGEVFQKKKKIQLASRDLYFSNPVFQRNKNKGLYLRKSKNHSFAMMSPKTRIGSRSGNPRSSLVSVSLAAATVRGNKMLCDEDGNTSYVH